MSLIRGSLKVITFHCVVRRLVGMLLRPFGSTLDTASVQGRWESVGVGRKRFWKGRLGRRSSIARVGVRRAGCFRAVEFEVAEDAGGGATDCVGIALAGESVIQGAQRSLAAFVVFERVDGGDPHFDDGVAEFVDDIEEVVVQVLGELIDVLIEVDERGDKAARLG